MVQIFDTIQVGEIKLENRIIMAPLTRMRSKQPGGCVFKCMMSLSFCVP